MNIDLDAVIAQAKHECSEMMGRLLMASGALAALQKHSDAQAKELAELRKLIPTDKPKE